MAVVAVLVVHNVCSASIAFLQAYFIMTLIMWEGGQIYCQEEVTSANTWVVAPSPTLLPLPLSGCFFLRNLRLAQHTDIHTWIEAKATC